jgi:hypothetical protein
MDARQATQTLEVIRTLMERTTQYQLLTARASLVAGSLAGAGALAFLGLNADDPWQFGAVWLVVFVGALTATVVGTVTRGRAIGERVWSRQARTVLVALAPSLFAALVLTVFFFARGWHLWLPGVWMLCYAQGALATSAYAPAPIKGLGVAVLLAAVPTLCLPPGWSVVMMGVVFGLGHLALGVVLLVMERRQTALKLYTSVA